MPDQSWWLMRDGTRLGVLVLDRIDQPWFHCRFTPTSAWESVRPTVEAWTAAVEGDDGDEPRITDALEAVDELGLFLAPVSGSERIDDILVHVEDGVARFRY